MSRFASARLSAGRARVYPWLAAAVLAVAAAGCAANGATATMAVAGDDDAWVSAVADGTGAAAANRTSDAGSRVKHNDIDDLNIGTTFDGAPESGADQDEKSTLGLSPGGPQNVAAFRALVQAGQVPPPVTFTMAGWLAEHGTTLPPAAAERPIDLHALAAVLAEAKDGTPEVVLQLGFNSAKSLQDLQPPMAIAIVIDTSGSMAGGPLEAARAGVLHLADHLPAGSWLTLVSFADEPTVDWPGAIYTQAQRKGLKDVLGGWQAFGATNLHGGLDKGLSAVLAAPGTYGARHVLLLSDGAATKGDVAPASLQALAGQAAGKATVSTIAYGTQAETGQLAAIATKTGGTHHGAVTPAALEALFVKDLGLFMAPVAKNLGVVLKLAPGWGLDQVYGFDLVSTAEGMALQPVASATQPKGDATGGGPDTTEPAADGLAAPGNPPVMSTLFASGHSAVVLARLVPPGDVSMAKMLDLNLASVTYRYTLTADGQKREHVVPVQLPGAFQVPDEGGFAYFASPIVRRAFALHRLGRAMQQAAVLHVAAKNIEARLLLEAVISFAGHERDQLDLGTVDPDDSIDAAMTLAGKLRDNLPGK